MPLKRIPIPTGVEIQNDGGSVLLEWGDGHRSTFGAYDLRVECPCAGCVDEMTGRRTLRPEHVARDVRLLHAARVGRYALQFTFGDGHATGIYTYEWLRAVCGCEVCVAGTGRAATDEPERNG